MCYFLRKGNNGGCLGWLFVCLGEVLVEFWDYLQSHINALLVYVNIRLDWISGLTIRDILRCFEILTGPYQYVDIYLLSRVD